MKRGGRQTLGRMFAWPIAIGTATAIGLVSGLMGDGTADAIAWVGLAVPLVVATVHLRRAATA